MPKAASIPRPEHPRPDFVRNTFYNLNGKWQFAFDDEDKGLKERWQDGKKLAKSILVPFCYQSEKSGIGGDEIHPFQDFVIESHGCWLRHGKLRFVVMCMSNNYSRVQQVARRLKMRRARQTSTPLTYHRLKS